MHVYVKTDLWVSRANDVSLDGQVHRLHRCCGVLVTCVCIVNNIGDNCTEVLELSVRRNFAHLSTSEKTVHIYSYAFDVCSVFSLALI